MRDNANQYLLAANLKLKGRGKRNEFDLQEDVSLSEIKNGESITLNIFFKGMQIGQALIDKSRMGSEGVWLIERIDIKPIFRNNKFGSALVESVNFYLKSKNKTGVLVNGIAGKKRDLYLNHGWKEIGGEEDYLTYNNNKIYAN